MFLGKTGEKMSSPSFFVSGIFLLLFCLLSPPSLRAESPYLLGGKYSIGYKKLDIAPPYTWYWGWDYFNCNPETVLNTMGQPCVSTQPNPEHFLYGPFGGYLIGGRWIGADGYPSPLGFVNYLEQAQSMRLTEETVGKPVWLTGPIFATSDGKSFVSPSVTIECTPTYTASLPLWSAQTGPYLDWIEQVAKEIKSHPNLKFFTITHGIDGEGYFIRYTDCENALKAKIAADPSFPDPLAGVYDYVNAVTQGYYRNFCDGTYDESKQICYGTMKPLFVQKTSWRDNAGQLGKFMPPMGIKFNAFTADTPDGVIYKRYWRGWGTVEAFIRYRNLVPTSIEPRYGNGLLGGEQGTYWFGLQAVWMRPTNLDVNPNYGLWGTAKEDPEYFDLIAGHLNVNAATTPDVWIAFRDTDLLCGAQTQEEYDFNICVSKAGDGSGIRGDYDFFLKRPEGIPTAKTVLLSREGLNKTLYAQEIPAAAQVHKFAKYVRRTDRGAGQYCMYFDVDNDYPWAGNPGQSFEVALSYLDIGLGNFYLETKTSDGALARKPILRQDSKLWKTVRVTINGAYFNDLMGTGDDGNGQPTYTDFRIYNGGPGAPDVYLHMVKVKGLGPKPTAMKNPTDILCQTANTSVYTTESPAILAVLQDADGNPIPNRIIRYTLSPYWYTNRITYGQTDGEGRAVTALDLSNLPALSSERFIHEIEVVFPGDSSYYGSRAVCYLPTNPPQAIRRTLAASLSPSTVKVGDGVTVQVQVAGGGGGKFYAEGEGFGLPACEGTLNEAGQGTCSFKIGGMAVAGDRVLGVYASSNGNLGGASTHLSLLVLDAVVDEPPPSYPSTPTNFKVVGKE